MIIIAESGATKTDWAILQDGKVVGRVVSKGLNPFLMKPEDIRSEISAKVIKDLPGRVMEVYFYGAGCILDKALMMEELLKDLFQTDQVNVMTDMTAAAHGLSGHDAGIVCILGTGSNSCLYDGNTIAKNVPPLGFILGNEGSAAHIGKAFLADLLRGMLPEGLKEEVLEEIGMDYGTIIDRIYRQNEGNALLSSLSPAIRKRTHIAKVHQIVMECFRTFLRRNVALYGRQDLPVHFVGSIAYHFEDILSQACFIEGYQIGMIMKSPIEGLIEYYRKR